LIRRKSGDFVFTISKQQIEEMKRKEKSKRAWKFDPRYLRWVPPKNAKSH
jgi:hypothetical protein